MTDTDDYPTKQELEAIRNWKPPAWNNGEFITFMDYIRRLWKYANSGYWEESGMNFTLHTAGWSGNEDIITAMNDNHVFWMLYWQGETRGGHYVFNPLGVEP